MRNVIQPNFDDLFDIIHILSLHESSCNHFEWLVYSSLESLVVALLYGD